MTELFTQNPSVVFFMVGGVCTVATMLIGVLLIKRRDNNHSNQKPVYKKNNNK